MWTAFTLFVRFPNLFLDHSWLHFLLLDEGLKWVRGLVNSTLPRWPPWLKLWLYAHLPLNVIASQIIRDRSTDGITRVWRVEFIALMQGECHLLAPKYFEVQRDSEGLPQVLHSNSLHFSHYCGPVRHCSVHFIAMNLIRVQSTHQSWWPTFYGTEFTAVALYYMPNFHFSCGHVG